MGHVTAGRTQAHQQGTLPTSLSRSEVLAQQARAQADRTLAEVRLLRRRLEPFNAAPFGAAINSAEAEVQSIVHRLREH
jgi:hypothetical protein